MTKLASDQYPSVCASSPFVLPVANWRPGACRNSSSQNLSIQEDVSSPRASRTLPFEKLFVRYVDWLRGGQEEEEEVLIDTVTEVAFSFSRATLCAMRLDRPGLALEICQHPV